MSNSIRNFLITIAPLALLSLGAQVHAQATDVDCSGCVNTKDIAFQAVTPAKIRPEAVTTGKIRNAAVTTRKIRNGAVTTPKIKDGAVTVDKVAPELMIAIGTFCPPGEAVVGMDASGNFVCGAFKQEWLEIDFLIGGTNVVNACIAGAKYIKRSDFDPGLWVGAQLCSNSRYKLFLASSAGGTYWEIADQSGNGQDHCELIGGTVTTAIDSRVTSPPLPSGFYRSSLGQPFVFASPPPSNAWRTAWYECGISVPRCNMRRERRSAVAAKQKGSHR